MSGSLGLICVVHCDTAARPDVEPGQFGQVDVRPDSDRADNNLGAKNASVGQGD